MSEKERNIAESLTRACELLPDGKKEYLIGYFRQRRGTRSHHWQYPL